MNSKWSAEVSKWPLLLRWSAISLLLGACGLGIATALSLKPLPETLTLTSLTRPRLLSSDGLPLTVSYTGQWNIYDQHSLHQIPRLLVAAVVSAEDKRFFDHSGVDWTARASALVDNAVALGVVRGASTITEQVVRILHPRPRSLWARWLEGFEARRLEQRFDKSTILEFYLNQVPYAANRRGVAQAARYYFDRDLDTLAPVEVLALSVLIRAPSRLDLWNDSHRAMGRLMLLAERMVAAGDLSHSALASMRGASLDLRRSDLDVHAPHFARFVHAHQRTSAATMNTTLNAELQRFVQPVLDQRLRTLAHRQVDNGAVLVVDHQRNEVLVWCVARPFDDTPGADIDAVTAARQPGSTLKPFVYTLALQRDWTAATLIDDAPLAESVGAGLHSYRNYSRRHYGLVSVRTALANSLNVPAVKALQHVGQGSFLELLRELGVTSLTAHPNRYGDGLALGNGEVSLFELVQAYTVLARQGRYLPLSVTTQGRHDHERIVLARAHTSLIANILADDNARGLEFGQGGVLDLPVQTAIKTGTSTDHRDTWAVGFNHRYTVGVWMGNLDRRPTDRLTGSNGPALVLRTVFAELNRYTPARPLYLDPVLARNSVCTAQSTAPMCTSRDEWFAPSGEAARPGAAIVPAFIRHPSNGLQLAHDPRVASQFQKFRFRLSKIAPAVDRVDWLVNGNLVASTVQPSHLWSVVKGKHRVQARLWWPNDPVPYHTATVSFEVK